MATRFALALLPLLAAAADPDPNKGWEGNYNRSQLLVATAQSITSLADLSSVTPPVHPAKVPGLPPSAYLLPGSCLGYLGPLGPYGPLGTLGPLGTNSWNPQYWISAFGNWSQWAQQNLDGPLTEKGPLGEQGPLGPAYYSGAVFEQNDFAVQLRALGLWAALGPIGPLGALGGLGPLGPVGAHGYKVDADGNYLNAAGAVVRNYTLWYDAAHTERRTFPLYEHYLNKTKVLKAVGDTSFLVTADCNLLETDKYTVKSDSNQLVTVVVVPLYQYDDYDLTVTLSGAKSPFAHSTTLSFVETAQFKAQAGARFVISVTLSGHYHALQSQYRLYVTGSTGFVDFTNIRGDHVVHY